MGEVVGVVRVVAWLFPGMLFGTLAACGTNTPGRPATGGAGLGVNTGSFGAGTLSSQAGATPTLGSGGASSGIFGSPANSLGAAGSSGTGARASTGGAGMGAGTAGSTGQAGDSGRGTPGGGAGQPPANGQCGTRTGMRGKTSRMVDAMGDKRTFIAYLPQAADPNTPLPLVYVFHGANQSGRILYDMTDYASLADSEKIAVVFPDGQGVSSATGVSSLSPWNVSDGGVLCGLGTLVSNPNPVDFPFMDAIKAEVLQDQCIDDQHIFATGFSMGGYMSHHIACMRPGIRAAAPHSGGTLSDLSGCTNKRMPIIIFHGNADSLIDEACDDPATGGPTASPTLWAQQNGCKTTYKMMAADGPSGKGQCYLYDGCPADGQVEACIFTDLPHAWAGATSCESCIGDGAGWASATQIQWAFFKKYAW